MKSVNHYSKRHLGFLCLNMRRLRRIIDQESVHGAFFLTVDSIGKHLGFGEEGLSVESVLSCVLISLLILIISHSCYYF